MSSVKEGSGCADWIAEHVLCSCWVRLSCLQVPLPFITAASAGNDSPSHALARHVCEYSAPAGRVSLPATAAGQMLHSEEQINKLLNTVVQGAR